MNCSILTPWHHLMEGTNLEDSSRNPVETSSSRLLLEEASGLVEIFVQSLNPAQTRLLSIVLRSYDLNLSLKSVTGQEVNVSWSLSRPSGSTADGKPIQTVEEAPLDAT